MRCIVSVFCLTQTKNHQILTAKTKFKHALNSIIRMKRTYQILAIGAALAIGIGSFASFKMRTNAKPLDTAEESFFDQLDSTRIVKLIIKSDFSTLIENRTEEIEQAAQLSLETTPNVFEEYPVKISLRGKTRRNICAFPPIKLNFSKSHLASEGLKTFDKYKLVTHCLDNTELVLKEYLAYKLYNQLTEYSFRTQLVELTYIDSGNAGEMAKQYGILLENYGELAERFSAKKMPDQLPKNTKIPNEDYQRLALYQYMIGNTDWNLFRQHNIKWLCMKDTAIPVPYDFDFSGLVNAPYAKPHPSLPIDSVRQRFLQWRGDQHEQLAAMRKELTAKQKEMMQTCKQFQALSASEREDIVTYLDEFFKERYPGDEVD